MTIVKYLIDFAVLLLLYIFVFYKKWKKRGKDIFLVRTVLYAYIAILIYFTLMPIIASLPFVFNHPPTTMNLVPFVDLIEGRGDYIRQIVLNILLTVPFGFLLPMTRRRSYTSTEVLLFTFLLSLAIEFIQPILSDTRTPDITDVITNTIGGILGYEVFVLSNKQTSNLMRKIRHSGEKQPEKEQS